MQKESEELIEYLTAQGERSSALWVEALDARACSLHDENNRLREELSRARGTIATDAVKTIRKWANNYDPVQNRQLRETELLAAADELARLGERLRDALNGSARMRRAITEAAERLGYPDHTNVEAALRVLENALVK